MRERSFLFIIRKIYTKLIIHNLKLYKVRNELGILSHGYKRLGMTTIEEKIKGLSLAPFKLER